MSGSSALDWVIPLLAGYLAGSIPFGLIFTRLAGTEDVRSIGSGNIGATNVLRTGRKGLAILTLLADMLKGYFVVWFFSKWGQDAAILAGFGAIVGHIFPFWLNFKGGKGVAVYVGILLALSWQGFLFFAVIWLVTAALFRFSSLAGLTATLVTPLFFLFQGKEMYPVAALFAAMTLLVWYKHRENIGRLLSRTESKIGKSSSG